MSDNPAPVAEAIRDDDVAKDEYELALEQDVEDEALLEDPGNASPVPLAAPLPGPSPAPLSSGSKKGRGLGCGRCRRLGVSAFSTCSFGT